MIASDSVILAEHPALARLSVVHGLGRTFVHPARRVLEAFSGKRTGRDPELAQCFLAGCGKVDFRCTATGSAAVTRAKSRSFASLRMTDLMGMTNLSASFGQGFSES
jgi:hypothetical protein